MKITRDNYEAWFLDYHEERLDDNGRAAVLAFVKANPDLQEEFYSFEQVTFEKSEIIFSEKDSLKFDMLSEQNFHLAAIAALENDLPESEKARVEKFIAENPAAQKEFDLLKKLKLQPDLSVVYPFKKNLKKPAVIAMKRWWYYAAAACIALLIGYNFMFRDDMNEKIATPVAQTEEKKTQPVVKDEIKEAAAVPEKSITATTVNQGIKPNQKVKPEKKTMHEPVLAEREIPVNENKPAEEVPVQDQVNNEPMAVQTQEEIEQPLYALTAADMPAKAESTIKESGAAHNLSGLLLSKVSRNKIAFDKEKDENGNVLAYNFRAGNFSVEKTKGK